MPEAYVGLGANLGDPPRQIEWALQRIALLPGTELVARSPLYRSAPLGPADQPHYCNAACLLRTALEPLALLQALQAIEAAAGRQRDRHWGPRTLDLDLLHIPGVAVDSPQLCLPHPQLHQRSFVLQPLRDIAPALEIPGHGAIGILAARVVDVEIALWREGAA
jgi:2-amino-4-hydroxy-6-hydroxymethyldihydropteridine diphosphokinase